jgi:hypothetical protein
MVSLHANGFGRFHGRDPSTVLHVTLTTWREPLTHLLVPHERGNLGPLLTGKTYGTCFYRPLGCKS